MEIGCLYRNRKMIDVDFLVVSITDFKIRGVWVTRESELILGVDSLERSRINEGDWRHIQFSTKKDIPVSKDAPSQVSPTILA